jgi:hypothetical protein
VTSAAFPHVTIGIPAFNGGPHIADALESARAQDYAPLDILIADDASIDETEAVCRRYAAKDSRIRYIRHPRNIGAVANFRYVLSQSQGKYFTWLAQDDVLTDSRYVSIMVDYLEAYPEVVACTSDFRLLDHEYPGPGDVMELSELRPERPWAEARREFFCWPQGRVSLAIYSMYRRDELVQIPMIARRYRGKPTSAWWEMPVLTALAGRGRLDALPGARRGKRSSSASDGWRTYQMASGFDLTLLGFQVKLLVLCAAWRLPLPWSERLPLLRLALGNFGTANLRRPFDLRVLIEARRRELETLRSTMQERSQLVVSLHLEIAKRREVLDRAAGSLLEPAVSAASAAPDVRNAPGLRPVQIDRDLDQDIRQSTLLDYFRPPPQGMLALCQRLNEEIGIYRQVCDEQLRMIDALHAEAGALLNAMLVMEKRDTSADGEDAEM